MVKNGKITVQQTFEKLTKFMAPI